VLRIVEEGDATNRERAIREINSGVLIAPARLLRQWLARLKPRNDEGELYLTDIVALALRSRTRVLTVVTDDAAEVQGVNDRLQLAGAEAEYRRRRAHALMRAGVTLIDPARLDVRAKSRLAAMSLSTSTSCCTVGFIWPIACRSAPIAY